MGNREGPHAGAAPADEPTVEELRRRVLEHEQRGRLFETYDEAARALDRFPGDRWLQVRAVLALARSGAAEVAERLYAEYGLADVADDEDAAALGARFAKDRVWRVDGDARAALAREAAAQYGAVHARTGGYFPGINEATLLLFAGDAARSREVAQRTLIDLAALAGDSYYEAATAAEAHLLLGDLQAASAELARSRALAGDDLGAVATTRRQLRRICEHLGLDSAPLDVLAAGTVAHFCGHMIAVPGADGRFPAAQEREVAGRIARALDEDDVRFGYGSLACGADILFAEALLARGAELDVVLPFRADEFEMVSVERGGPGWRERYRACLDRAAAVHYATEDSYLADDALFTYASRYAMGLARLRARHLDAPVRQIAVWDGLPPEGGAGTATDVATWRALGLEQRIIELGAEGGAAASAAPSAFATRRAPRAMLFGDFKGFSRLGDRHLQAFVATLLGTIAECLDHYGDAVRLRNTWGDGLYVVFDDLVVAARCALDLQQTLAEVPLEARELPASLALRLGGHYGPVYEQTDPVTGRVNFFGAQVSRAARIEPITPVGCVYVSEPFAAGLALAAADELACEYVGTVPTAKDYGELPMYLLRRV